ncbi:MAG: hypothetical protein ABIN01_13180 [Ferruginibacter sp.]
MKTFLIIAFFALAITGCDNKKGTEKDDTKSATTDSAVSTLADLTAETDIKKIICQNWKNKEDAEDAELSGSGEGLEIPYRGLSFFEDATVVENPRDKMRFGKWSLNEADKTITIEFNKGGKVQYKIVAIGANQMILMTTAGNKKVEYRADAKMQKNPADDPFYISNNQWRIKPTHAESENEIKERTAQCVLFYAKFLEDNAGRGGNIISFVGLPTCFKWYRGGVSIIGKDKLEDKWLNCYYNKEQALKAHAMLDKIISKKYKWDKEETNWVKQSAGVVKQMHDTLRLL